MQFHSDYVLFFAWWYRTFRIWPVRMRAARAHINIANWFKVYSCSRSLKHIFVEHFRRKFCDRQFVRGAHVRLICLWLGREFAVVIENCAGATAVRVDAACCCSYMLESLCHELERTHLRLICVCLCARRYTVGSVSLSVSLVAPRPKVCAKHSHSSHKHHVNRRPNTALRPQIVFTRAQRTLDSKNSKLRTERANASCVAIGRARRPQTPFYESSLRHTS